MDLKYLITLENKKNLIYFFKFYEFYFAYLTALGLGVKTKIYTNGNYFYRQSGETGDETK